MESFWEERYRAEGKIWGDAPSPTALHAIRLFQKAGFRRVLVPGSGYGRNAAAFARAGFDVTGVEYSGTAVRIARGTSPSIRYCHGSVLDPLPADQPYDGIYCFNVLHLFRAGDRDRFLRNCREVTRTGGGMFFVVFSEQDKSFGQGRETEKDTFESRPGREVHYFTRDGLLAAFAGTDILSEGLVGEEEDHGDEGRHTHLLRYVCARKR
ncbi:MAG TPA: class I SAM-dependent methyltransferase [Methanoregula sp.]|nr:class I SAM-dependent methyltransferase [Methanoregula sp.]